MPAQPVAQFSFPTGTSTNGAQAGAQAHSHSHDGDAGHSHSHGHDHSSGINEHGHTHEIMEHAGELYGLNHGGLGVGFSWMSTLHQLAIHMARSGAERRRAQAPGGVEGRWDSISSR